MTDKAIRQFSSFESCYEIGRIEDVLTPALAVYEDLVDSNIRTTIELLGGNADRWRPHVKTAKIGSIMRRFVTAGVTSFKCSTTLELLTAGEAGAADVLIAYPLVGAAVQRVIEIANRFPSVRISALVENKSQVSSWRRAEIGLFIDINPGMNRTGIEQERIDQIVALARHIQSEGLSFRGLHYYDGHLSGYDLPERRQLAFDGYNALLAIAGRLARERMPAGEVITAGTPAFPCTLMYPGFSRADFLHRASPGTVVYCDATSLSQMPLEYRYRPAALVVTTVVSRPSPTRITCDAGHKTVSADSGVPTCAVLGRPDLLPAKPSEEHLPLDVAEGFSPPAIGEQLYLVPRHICPTVNNFDYAMIIRDGRVADVERVTARGREAPLGWNSNWR